MDVGADYIRVRFKRRVSYLATLPNSRRKTWQNIQREIILLSRAKATLDDLNVMIMLFNDQRNMLKVMDGIGKFILALETADSESDSSSSSDATADPDKIVVIEEAYPGQRATVIWGARNDPDEFSLPLAKVNASIDEINAMLERARRANQSINFLIDLKLKQNSVMDAQESLKMTRETTKQGRTVLIFTLTTLVFLPLSFMTSFFTLDISQFRTNAEGKLVLGYVSYIVFPISSLISAALIWTAFRIEYIEAAWIWMTLIMRHIIGKIKNSATKKRDGPRYMPTDLPESKVRRDTDLEAQGDSLVPTVTGSVLQPTN
ncbi:hypothetical protein Asppvi_001785 [Aspergillus pseudoviridinutans]|uniref:Uncharacterized protein n=1 Tax=Aspergillus pseudoviridinutans TaxID=1517512 RepID=A0A9P3BJK0_9EURO|nr:uncharacterized protein Asppvi_001785 [Aspergillus pseudoviridinutans]GIJ92507.1 hypothetical protein Asppvi_001785 [Aspergillus pseudoviridinutans]